MYRIRLLFSKTGSAKFISHLDLMSTLARALRRAGVRLSYSEGFNPHPYLSVALPLSVGCGSLCELVDIGVEDELNPDGLPEIINPALPDGLNILDAYLPQRKFIDIKWIGLSVSFHYDNGTPVGAAKKLEERFAADIINVTKKSKKGICTINIAQFIRDVAFTGSDVVNFSVKVSAQEPSINPKDLIAAFDGDYSRLAPDHSSFTRTEVYDRDMSVFR